MRSVQVLLLNLLVELMELILLLLISLVEIANPLRKMLVILLDAGKRIF